LSTHAPITPSDRVGWGGKDGSINDISVVNYLRARSMWASRPVEYQTQS
jgi:hypothetical protein